MRLEGKKFAVVGSGISGLACANILLENNFIPTVFEGSKKTGGLISCSKENGNLFHRVGGHVFNSKNEKVSHWFWMKFDKKNEFIKAKRNAVIYMNKEFKNYPIELNLKQLDPSIANIVINELIDLSGKRKDLNNCSFEEFLHNNFGRTLCEIYFKKYNKKIWNRDLSQIPMDWLEGKLPIIDPKEILFKNIFSSTEDNMVHSNFYYPKIDGSQFIVNRLSEGINIFMEKVEDISIKGKNIYLNHNNKFFDSIIFTGDIRNLSEILDKNIIKELEIENLLEEISSLDSNSTSIALCECDSNPYSWVYLPDEDLKPHRMIMTGNFSENNNSKSLNKGRISCTVECTGEVKLSNFKDEISKIPFNSKFIAYNFSKNSYIIQNKHTRFLIKELKRKLYKKNIFLCGRFSEWEYFNMDVAIESAMKVCKIAINK